MALTETAPKPTRPLRAADERDKPAAQLRNFLQDGGVIVSRWELTRHAENVMRACRGLVALEGWCHTEDNSLTSDFVRVTRTPRGFSTYTLVHEGVRAL